METQREAYAVSWITRLLQRVKQSGLDNIQLGEAENHWRSPVMAGMPMVDPILHRLNIDEFIAVVKKHFNVQGNRIIIPDDIQVQSRQETVSSDTPFSNRKKLANRVSGTAVLRYFDPFIGSSWLTVFSEILALTDVKPESVQLLSSEEKIQQPLQRQAFESLVKQLGSEFGIKIKVKLTDKKKHPRFFDANGKMWKIGHSLNNLDQFEGLDEQIERKTEWEKFWMDNWQNAKTIVSV